VSFVSLFALAATVAPAHAETALTAIEDAYVDASFPNSNFGSATLLNTDGTPRVTTYLKFNVSGLPTPPSAALRVFTTTFNDTPFEVRTVADTSWSESTITAQNAPAVGDIVAASGPVKSNTWITLNVSSALTGDGVVALALTTAGSKAVTIHSREGTNRPQLVIPAPPSPSPFVVRRSTSDSSVYIAESASTGIAYSGALKSVVEPAASDLSRAGGGVLHFTAGLFDLGDSQFELKDMVGVTFEGEGIDVTTISNFRSIEADTEVFDVTRATRGGIRDLTVSAGGPRRSSSDAIDFDGGNYQLIERVKVANSRARAIFLDGKDLHGGLARGAANNVIRDCVITNVPSDGMKLLAASNNRIEGCTITNVGRHAIAVAKSSPLAAIPNEKSRNNVIVGNRITEAGLDGINILSSDANQVLGNTILNSGNLENDRDGIRIKSEDSITADNNVVSGNTATDNQSPKTQRYGLMIFNSLCKGTFIGSDNNFAGNLAGEILDLGTGTTYGEPTPDTSPPTVSLTAPADGASVQGTITLSADAADNLAVSRVEFLVNGTLVGTDTSSPYATSFDTTTLANGSATLSARAADAAGNQTTSSARTVTINNPAPLRVTFVPSDDAYVEERHAKSNHGSATTLRLDASPVFRSYLKFSVSGISGVVERATLRVYSITSSTSGYDARGAADNNWTEATLTYKNAPAFGGVVGSTGAFGSNRYTEIDVTPLISGNGTYTIVLTTTSSATIDLASRETANDPQLIVEAAGTSEPSPGSDTEPPSVPSGLTATATGATTVELAWSASTDNVAVAGYRIYRDGTAIATVGATATTFKDTTVAPSTTYAYTVDAFDAAANRSSQSAAVQVTTPEAPPAPTLFTFAPSADAYVNESDPTTNNGSRSDLRLDGSPLVRSYLRFSVSGVSGTVSRARLRVYANSASSSGYEAHGSSDTSWGELTLTYANAPAFGPAIVSSGAFTSGAYTEVDVTPLITGDGVYTIVLTATGTTAISLGSRESLNAPQLVIETAP
jgi:parallel beta-helix repeat protein